MYPGNHIMFDNAHLNIGNGYKGTDGVFIAPKAGIHLFSVSLLSSFKPNQYVKGSIYIIANRLCIVFAYESDSVDILDQGSLTVAAALDVGDEVLVRHDLPENGSMAGWGGSSFSGILIKKPTE